MPGRIVFDGADITALPAYRRSLLGLARSFQITSLFPDFTALDNVALAVQAHAGHSFRFWRDARRESALREPARAALDRVGLLDRADVPCRGSATASIASSRSPWRSPPSRACCCSTSRWPGMGPDESARMVALLRELKRRIHHRPDRARHGGRVRARRPYHASWSMAA